LSPDTKRHFCRVHQRLIKAINSGELSPAQAEKIASNIAQQTTLAVKPFHPFKPPLNKKDYVLYLNSEQEKRKQAIKKIHSQNLSLGAKLGYAFLIALGVLVGTILGALMGYGLFCLAVKALVAAGIVQEIPPSPLSPLPVFFLASNTVAGTFANIGAGIVSSGIVTGIGASIGGIAGGYAAHRLWSKVKPASEKLTDELTMLNKEEMIFQASTVRKNNA
jgi:hypothetical protein